MAAEIRNQQEMVRLLKELRTAVGAQCFVFCFRDEEGMIHGADWPDNKDYQNKALMIAPYTAQIFHRAKEEAAAMEEAAARLRDFKKPI